MSSPIPSPSTKSEELSHELHDLVLELAVAVHKRGIYPASHPMQRGAVDGLTSRLTSALTTRLHLSLGVARQQLVVDGVSTNADHPLIRELAQQLHDHQLGAIRVRIGVERHEVDGLIAVISTSLLQGGDPLGALPADELPRWPNIELYPIAFDQLELLDEAGLADEGDDVADRDARTRGSELWVGLARAAMVGGWSNDTVRSPRLIAESIDRNKGDQAYDQVIVGYLLQIVGELKSGGAVVGGALRRRVSQLMGSLSQQGVEHLLRMGGVRRQREDFLARATDTLSASAVVDLVRAAASLDGTPISNSVLRLLTKMARDAESRRPASRAADTALRSVVRRLLRSWTLDDPNPEAYSMLLSDVSQHDREATRDLRRDGCEPERLLEISLDVGTIVPSTEAALERLVMRDGVAATLDRLHRYPESHIRETLVDRLLNESMMREQLAAERPDVAVLQHAVDRMRLRAVAPLLHALQARDGYDVPWIVDLLQRIGVDALPLLGAALPHLTAAALRHVLAVFDRLDAWPLGSAPATFARHADAAVRREAIRYLLKHDETREQGILLGLRDTDMRTLNASINWLMRHCSLEAARVLVQRYDDPLLGAELRARSLRAVAAVQHVDIRRWLITTATTTRWLSGSVRLRKSSLELLAALAALAAHHGEDPDVKAVLQLALRHRDEHIRRAATPRTGSPGRASGRAPGGAPGGAP